MRTPVGLADLDAVPMYAGAFEKLTQRAMMAHDVPRRIETTSQKKLHESQQSRMFLNEGPVDPTGVIVLAIGIVITLLASTHLVAGQQHRRAVGQQQERHKVAGLAFAKLHHAGVLARAFHAAIPAQIVVATIAVSLPIALVMFVVVGHQVRQRKAVVAGDEVDAMERASAATSDRDRRCRQAGWREPAPCLARLSQTCEYRRGSARSIPPNVPKRGKTQPDMSPAASQASAISFVPARIGSAAICSSSRWIGQYTAVAPAPEDGSQIEAKAIDMHLRHPIVEAIDDLIPHHGVIAVNRIAEPRIV